MSEETKKVKRVLSKSRIETNRREFIRSAVLTAGVVTFSLAGLLPVVQGSSARLRPPARDHLVIAHHQRRDAAEAQLVGSLRNGGPRRDGGDGAAPDRSIVTVPAPARVQGKIGAGRTCGGVI